MSEVTILIVDDHAMMRNMIKKMLIDTPWKILEAENGKVALEVLESNPNVSCILTDYNMPVLDGKGFLMAVKQNEKLSGLPIFIVSSVRASEIVEDAIAAGADGWIKKPFKKNELLEALNKVFQ